MTLFRSELGSLGFVIIAVVFAMGCGETSPPQMHAAAPSDDPVLVGAGDIASCWSRADEATARLLDEIPGTVFTLGDHAYRSKKENPLPCYDASWGRHKRRTRPVPGNHEYLEGYIDEYFDYFGSAAGEKGKGYYSYDLGRWHIIALNSVIDAHWSGEQGKWLRADLTRNRHLCTLAYFHHPRFSSGSRAPVKQAEQLWWMLSEGGVDVIVTGHDHIYERFAPLDKYGNRDDREGIRSFIVGTGGGFRPRLRRRAPNSEVRSDKTFGVLKLTLKSAGYDWKFVPVRGSNFTDSGSGSCH
jgi:hypothetical protein